MNKNYPHLAKQASDRELRDRRARRLPLWLAILLGVPLLAIGLFFSYQFGEVVGFLIQLQASFGQMLVMLVLAFLAPAGLILWIAFLLIAWRRKTLRWRWWWSAGALAAAAAGPIAVLIGSLAGV